MKNLMNKVLVVLTVSAVFAGSIGATPPRKKTSTETVVVSTGKMTKHERATVEMAKRREAVAAGDFWVNVKEYGKENFGVWTRQARIDALIKQYGDLDKAPKNLRLFLIGDEKNQTVEYRLKYKKAVDELANTTTKDAIEEVKVATKNAEEASTPEEQDEAQQVVEEKTGYLASLIATAKSHLTPNVMLAAKVALGAAVVTGATYAVDAAAEYAGMGRGWGASARGLVSGPVGYAATKAGEFGTYVGTTRAGQAISSGWEGAKGLVGYGKPVGK